MARLFASDLQMHSQNAQGKYTVIYVLIVNLCPSPDQLCSSFKTFASTVSAIQMVFWSAETAM